MHFLTANSPHLAPQNSVTRMMLKVLLGLVPGIVAMTWYFGVGVLVNIAIAVVTALACEAAMLRVRDRPVKPFLGDLSAIVTAVLLALCLPTLAPWWLTVIGTAFAIIVAKHLYGGLGYNPFNPAMMGYAILLVSFPREMTIWLTPGSLVEAPLGAFDILSATFGGGLPQSTFDAVTAATPLDYMKTRLGLNETVEEIRQISLFGDVAGFGWEWVGGAYVLGGLWLLYTRVISWHIPVGMMAGLLAISGVFYLVDPGSTPSPLFHLLSGGTLLGAFFIATDPVSAATSPRGRIIYGLLIGVLTYVIRTWGGYPDGVAFAVILINMAVPTIDYYTMPRTYGHKRHDV